jgi:hypothetical protein
MVSLGRLLNEVWIVNGDPTETQSIIPEEHETMNTKNWEWSGYLLILSGLLIIVPALIHPAQMNHDTLHSPIWAVSHIGVGLGFLVVIPALSGWYIHLGNKHSKLNLVAFVLASIGSAGIAAWMLAVETLWFPYIESVAGVDAIMDGNAMAVVAPFQPVSALLNLVPLVGFVTFGIAVLASGQTGRWSGALVILGIVLATFGSAPIVYGTGYALMGTAFISAGYLIVSKRSEAAPQTLVQATE